MTETDESKIPKITTPIVLLIALFSGIYIALGLSDWTIAKLYVRIIIPLYFCGLGGILMYVMLVRSNK